MQDLCVCVLFKLTMLSMQHTAMQTHGHVLLYARPDLTAGVEGLVSILSDQHGQHLGAVQSPPLQHEAGLRRGLRFSSQFPLPGVIRVAPRLHLAQEVHNL